MLGNTWDSGGCTAVSNSGREHYTLPIGLPP